ncbi:hypothetical protein EES37_20515 [Streptomyces sp. ADI91-18]|nr:hypothetical protein EES37_20515 [Streptomyces sp. ADI91-18]
MRPRARRRRDRDGHARHLHRLQPPARPRDGRPLQAVRRRRRRHRVGRGRRHAARRTALGRAAQRAPGAGRGPRLGDQPGRRLQRPHRSERPLAAARHPPGPGQRRSVRRRRRRGRGPRHGHDPRRPDRSPGAAGHVRPGPAGGPAAAARLHQVQHGPHAGRRGCRGHHQDGAGHAARDGAEDAARGRAVPARRLVRGCRRAADGVGGLAGDRTSAPRGHLVVRHQWHERAHDHRAGPGRGRGDRGRDGYGAGPAVRAVGEVGGRAERPGGPPADPPAGHAGGRSGRHGLLVGHPSRGFRPPGGGRGRDPGGAARRTGRAGGRRRGRLRDHERHRGRRRSREAGLPVQWAGQSAARDGA